MSDSLQFAKLESVADEYFPIWQSHVRVRLRTKDPESYAVIKPPVAAQPAITATADSSQTGTTAVPAVPAPAVPTTTAADAADENAVDALRACMSAKMCAKYDDITSGRALWARLASDHDAVQDLMADQKENALRTLTPMEDELVSDFVQRAGNAYRRLKKLGRGYPIKTFMTTLFDRIRTARPQWDVPLELIERDSKTATAPDPIEWLTNQLMEREMRHPKLRVTTSPEPAVVLAAHADAPQSRKEQELQARVAQLERQLAAARASTSGPSAPQRSAEQDFLARLESLERRFNDQQRGRGDQQRGRGGGGHQPRGVQLDPCHALMASTNSALEWVVDSGASHHMSPGEFAATFTNYRKLGLAALPVTFGKRGSIAYAVGVGDVIVAGLNGPTRLQHVLHVPDLAGNLFSVRAGVSQGISVHFDMLASGQHSVLLMKRGRVLMQAHLRAGMYFLDVAHHACAAHATALASDAAWRWHRSLGHTSFGTLADMARKGLLGDCKVTPAEFLQAREDHLCAPCAVGKLRRQPHPSRSVRADRPLHRMHMDVLSMPIPAEGSGGASYVVTMTDEATGWSQIKLVKRKSDVPGVVRSMLLWCENQLGLRVRRVRHDRGGEFVNSELAAFYESHQIESEATAGYCPESNGIAERLNGVLMDKVRAMLADAGLPKSRWGDAIVYANDVRNCVLQRGAAVTPHQALWGRAPDMSCFHIFGSRVFAHVPDTTARNKLSPRAVSGRFLGFQQPFGSGIHRVLLDDGRLVLSRTVVWDDRFRGAPPPLVAPAPAGTQQPPAAPPRPEQVADDEGVVGAARCLADGGAAIGSAAQRALPANAPAGCTAASGVTGAHSGMPCADAADAAPCADAAGAAPGAAVQGDAADVALAPEVLLDPPACVAEPVPARVLADTSPAGDEDQGAGLPDVLAGSVEPHDTAVPVHDGTCDGGQPPPAELPRADLPQTHAGRARRGNAGVPPPRFGFANSAQARVERRVHWADPVAEECALDEHTSIKFPKYQRTRTGGSSRGVIARLLQPVGRLGMALLRPRWLPAYKADSSATAASASAGECVDSVFAEAGGPADLSSADHSLNPAGHADDAWDVSWGNAPATRNGVASNGSCNSHAHAMRAELQDMAAKIAPDPVSVADALARPDAAAWQQAIDDELASCISYDVWEATDLPAGKHALPSRFVLQQKRDGRYKARLVAGGHKQVHGLDFEDTFAPVCMYRTMRMMTAVCARHALELRQFDICTAFLNGDLAEEVYIRPPKGGAHLAGAGQVLRLRRALYGLRQAPRAWNQRLTAELKRRGFVQSDADPSLWMLHSPDGTVLALFYVDDGLVAAKTGEQADALVALVASMFAIRALGEPKDFLGIRITRDREARTIKIDQEDKALALAHRAGVSGQRRSVPMSCQVHSELRAATPGEAMADIDEYQSILGSLSHLAHCTRPDVAHAAGALASYNAAPSRAHYEALLDVVRYVGSTASRGITYGHSGCPVQLFCDANFASCQDTRRSTTGWCATMYGGAVSWQSKKQATTAASTMDAEYQACGAAAREALSLRKGLKELSVLTPELHSEGPLQIMCDNQAAIALCKERKEGQRVKHIDVVHHFARDRVELGEIEFVYCKSEDNVSDCLTKALRRIAFESGLKGLGML